MRADDPRHGSEAGAEQHVRDGEKPCDECRDADLKAARRRNKRKSMGYRYQVPVDAEITERIEQLRARGATYDDIAKWADISPSQAWRVCQQGPGALVYARTYLRLKELCPEQQPVTPIGLTRRLRALAWLGYSASKVAAEAGVHQNTVQDMTTRPSRFASTKVKTALVETYERLSMRPADPESRHDKAGATRARNLARRNGWAPPLAWDSIDDPAETPQGYSDERSDRAQALRDMAEWGYGVTEASRRLGVDRHALQKWCGRKGLSDVYRTLAGRESLSQNRRPAEEGAA